MKIKGLTLTSKIVFHVTFVVACLMSVATPILLENAGIINTSLGITTSTGSGSANGDNMYFKTDYKTMDEVKQESKNLIEETMKEGAVLLKNDNTALPLARENNVSLYGVASYHSVVTGMGSSSFKVNGNQDPFADIVTLEQGLTNAGLSVNQELNNWYRDNGLNYVGDSGSHFIGYEDQEVQTVVQDAPWSDLPEAKNNQANAAIMVLARNSGEAVDLYMDTTLESEENGTYRNIISKRHNGDPDNSVGDALALTQNEQDVLRNLKALKDDGKISKIIVLMNSASPLQCEFLEDEAYDIDAAIWCGTLGTNGANAIGKLLTGEYNFSGRTADTFWADSAYNPVYFNMGSYEYQNSSALKNYFATLSEYNNKFYVAYQEGIYNGYKYTETRYEDYLMSRENVGEFDYETVVTYPFGYGLSYSTFEYSNFNVVPGTEEIDHKLYDKYTITIDVTNTGDVTAKEAVQLYLQKPYIEGGIEKASVELVDFGKTPLLESGQTATITMEVSGKDLASYDSYDAKTYVVDEGTYYFTVAKDSHEAINNILADKGYTTQDGMTEAGDREMVYSFDKEEDKTTYSTSLATGNQITNKFDNADLNIYDNANEANHVDYISRSDWTGTVKYGLNADNTRTYDREVVIPTQQMKDDLEKSWGGVTSCKAQPTLIPEEAKTSDRGYPTFGSTSTSYTLAMLRAKADEDEDPTNDEWIDYNDPMWDDLLDQMTWDDLVSLLSDGERKNVAMGSVSKPAVIDHNGGNGPNQSYSIGASNEQGLATRKNDPLKNESPVVYPCNGIVASTFNKELAYYYGCQWGEDMLWAGMAGLYGMGMNIHRSAYGGRNFEYYSEDPLLMGVIAGETVRGMATRGAYVYLKHCVLNDQETYRCGGFTWANEQTIREIYLKPYEIAISEYGAQGVMGSLNSIGMMSSGTQGFFNTVLRDEFGMTGAAVTDTTSAMGGNFAVSVFTGNDLPDGTISDDAFDFAAPTSEGGTGEYGEFAWAMRESAHRILYTVVHSNAMNGIAATDKIYKITPDWIKAVNAIQISFGALLGLSAAEVLVCIFLINKDNLKKIFVHHDDEEAN